MKSDTTILGTGPFKKCPRYQRRTRLFDALHRTVMKIKSVHILVSLSLASCLSLQSQTVTNQNNFTQADLAYMKSNGIDPNSVTIVPSITNSDGQVLTPKDVAYLRSLGYSDEDISKSKGGDSQPSKVTLSPTPPDLKNAIVSMNNFLGMTNAMLPADVISMKSDALKFRINNQDYDYSGHYTVLLAIPRLHKSPYFGLGSPDKAKFVSLEDFDSDGILLPDATIWEKSNGFIDVEAMGKEWIYSGTYTIQN